jgi:hypothetical protein
MENGNLKEVVEITLFHFQVESTFTKFTEILLEKIMMQTLQLKSKKMEK